MAKRAGLNKVLIYRYFGDWDGYLYQLAAGLNLWKEIRIELVAGLNFGALAGFCSCSRLGAEHIPTTVAQAAYVVDHHGHRTGPLQSTVAPFG